MACDCLHNSIKHFTRVDPSQQPPVVLGSAFVTIDSSCQELEEDAGGGNYYADELSNRQQQTGHDQKALRCFNYIDVSLVRGTANWKITEVRVGDDVLASNIAVGGAERFVLGPCVSCEVKPASVKIVDGNGNLQANLTGLKACHCNVA